MSPQVIALSGDFAKQGMLERDMGDLASSVNVFFDSEGWRRFKEAVGRLLDLIRGLSEPPILIGYSRGGSVIAMLSELVPIRAVVLYESPVVDSVGVGGSFPVLMIWNDAGIRYGRRKVRRIEASKSIRLWKENHPVTELKGSGGHWKIAPVGHDWDCSLNGQIESFILQNAATITIDGQSQERFRCRK